MSYFTSVLSDIVTMNNFLHYPSNLKSAIISNMNLKFLVFNIKVLFAIAFTVEHVKNLLQRDVSLNWKKYE